MSFLRLPASYILVVPAKAGIQLFILWWADSATAGMTRFHRTTKNPGGVGNRQKKSQACQGLGQSFMRKAGFEPAQAKPTTPSRWRVYQFHHFRIYPQIRCQVSSAARAGFGFLISPRRRILIGLRGRLFLSLLA